MTPTVKLLPTMVPYLCRATPEGQLRRISGMPWRASISLISRRLFRLAIQGPPFLQLAAVRHGHLSTKTPPPPWCAELFVLISATGVPATTLKSNALAAAGCLLMRLVNPVATLPLGWGERSNIDWGSAATSPSKRRFKGFGTMGSGHENA